MSADQATSEQVGNQRGGVQLQAHQVILRPLVTEKGVHQSQRDNAYTFAVHPLATKGDVRDAVQFLWPVRVIGVRTQTRRGKPRRSRLLMGHTSDWKKAIVKLHDDDRISFF